MSIILTCLGNCRLNQHGIDLVSLTFWHAIFRGNFHKWLIQSQQLWPSSKKNLAGKGKNLLLVFFFREEGCENSKVQSFDIRKYTLVQEFDNLISCCFCWLWSMGVTPLFETFSHALSSFCLVYLEILYYVPALLSKNQSCQHQT